MKFNRKICRLVCQTKQEMDGLWRWMLLNFRPTDILDTRQTYETDKS